MKALKITLKIFLWLIITIILLVTIVLTGVVWILTPSHLTPLVEEQAANYINADIKIGKVELTIWKTFPYATLDVDSLTLVSHNFDKLPADSLKKLPEQRDSLVSFDKFHIDINLLNIIAGDVVMRDIIVQGPKVNLVAFNDSIVNYDIVKPQPPKEEEEESKLPHIEFSSIEFSDCKGIRYFDAKSDIDANLNLKAFQFSISEKDKALLILNAFVGAKLGGKLYADDFPVNINTDLKWQPDSMLSVSSKRCLLEVGEVPINITFDADFNNPPTIKSASVDLKDIDLFTFAKYLPQEFSQYADDFESDIAPSISASLQKPYVLTDSILPFVKLKYDVPSCYLKYKPIAKHCIDKLELHGSCNVNGKKLDATVVNLDVLKLQAHRVDLNTKAKIITPISDPHLIGDLDCKVDIPSLITALAIPLDYSITGNANAKTQFNVRLSDVLTSKYTNVAIHGDVHVSNLTVQNAADSIYVYANTADIALGSKETFTTAENKTIGNLLKASVRVDSLKALVKGADAVLRKGVIALGARSEILAFSKAKKFVPLGGKVMAEKLRFIDLDSTRISVRDFDASVRMYKPVEAEPPVLSSCIKAARLRYADHTLRASIRNGDIDIVLKPHLRRQRVRLSMDSLRAANPGKTDEEIIATLPTDQQERMRRRLARNDSTKRRRGGENMDLSIDTASQGLFRKWDLSGSILAERGRISTPYFPLRNVLHNLDMTLCNDSVIVNHARLQSGRSSLVVSGGIRNIRTTVLGRNRVPLNIRFEIESDTLDINQLMAALYAGEEFRKQYGDNALDTSDDVEIEFANPQGETVFSAFVVPINIDADIDFNAKYAKYTSLELSNMRGCLAMKDGVVRFSDIHTDSNVGNLDFNALYAARSKQRIRCMFELGLNDIRIDQLIDLIPDVDSIMPMLNSMEGRVMANIVASAKLDSLMNVELPSLKAELKIHGDSLILLDSETFATIAKYARFKNRNRNLIDQMSVEAAIQNSQLEVYPFLFEMDRYRFGVMGYNDLNLNLNYHISVLKSPIPFKFGVNVSGTPEKLKIRLGKAKFKDGMVGTSQMINTNQTINLREQIHRIFNRGYQAAANYELDVRRRQKQSEEDDKLTAEDSLQMQKAGLIEAPTLTPQQRKEQEKAERKAKKDAEKREKALRKKDD